MRTLRFTSLLLLVVLVSACSNTDGFIKRKVNGFESKIAREVNALTVFSRPQKTEIDRLSRQTAHWARTTRLPILTQHLRLFAANLESGEKIDWQRARQLRLLVEKPLALSSQPAIVEGFARLAYSLDRKQLKLLEKNMQRRLARWYKKKLRLTLRNRRNRVIYSLNWALRNADTELTRQQTEQIDQLMMQRKSDLELQMSVFREVLEDFNALLSSNADSPMAESRFVQECRTLFRSAEAGIDELSPPLFEHNLSLSFKISDVVLQELNASQRVQLAGLLRHHAELLEGLAMP